MRRRTHIVNSFLPNPHLINSVFTGLYLNKLLLDILCRERLRRRPGPWGTEGIGGAPEEDYMAAQAAVLAPMAGPGAVWLSAVGGTPAEEVSAAFEQYAARQAWNQGDYSAAGAALAEAP